MANDKRDGYVQICVGCCKLNRENSKTLPVICPKTNMPCFAIDPQYLIPTLDEKFLKYIEGYNIAHKNDNPRIEISCRFIDQSYVNTRCRAFDDLAQNGNKTIYTMQAY